MAKEHSNVVAGTIATVIGGLILAGLTWLGGLLPAVWNGIVSGLSWVWSIVSYQASLPVGLLFMAATALFLVGYFLSRKRSASPKPGAASANPHTAEKTEVAEFSQLERGVVRVLANADGSWLRIQDIADQLRTSNLIIEQAIEKLYANDMIRDSHNYIYGTSFRLSSKGRDYAISQGYVSGWAQLP